MDEFNTVREVCSKIGSAAEQISEYEKSIEQLQSHGEQAALQTFAEAQVLALEQLQKLVLHLTGVLLPQQEEEFEENLDEAEGGSVFMAGELDDKKPPIEEEYPVTEQEEVEYE